MSSVRQVGHEDRRIVAVGSRSEIRAGQRGSDAVGTRRGEGGGEPRFAQCVVVGGPGDPVASRRGPLEDEPPSPRSISAERGAGPAVGRERLLGQAVEAVSAEQVGELPARHASAVIAARASAQHGAGTSSAPSGPPSTYTTCESGQLRVRTTTSGSVVGGVLLDVDLAGRDVDEVARRRVDRVLEPGRAPRVARRPRQDVDRRLAVAVMVDPRLVAGRGRHDRRVQPRRADRSAPRSRSTAPCRRAGRRSSAAPPG